jgi:hypothetical protein
VQVNESCEFSSVDDTKSENEEGKFCVFITVKVTVI